LLDHLVDLVVVLLSLVMVEVLLMQVIQLPLQMVFLQQLKEIMVALIQDMSIVNTVAEVAAAVPVVLVELKNLIPQVLLVPSKQELVEMD
jgi:hypothetical protein